MWCIAGDVVFSCLASWWHCCLTVAMRKYRHSVFFISSLNNKASSENMSCEWDNSQDTVHVAVLLRDVKTVVGTF